MSKLAYVLEHFGDSVGVILAGNHKELKTKTSKAIKENVEAEKDGQFNLTIGDVGDWGEYIDIKLQYVEDGSLVEDNEFALVKLVSY